MRRSLLVLAALFSSLLVAGTAHAQVQIFGGYSYLRPSVTVQPFAECPMGSPSPCPSPSTTHPNLNGWEASGTYNPFHVLGFTADFDGNFGTVLGSTLHVQTAGTLSGARFAFRARAGRRCARVGGQQRIGGPVHGECICNRSGRRH